jgi:cyclase
VANQLKHMRICTICVAGMVISISSPIIGLARPTQDRAAQDSVRVTEITPQVLVFATTAGNVVASVGMDGALLVGMPSADSTARITSILAERTRSRVRYVVIAPGDIAHSEGDAGWGRLGAFVAMHENALQRIGGNVMGRPRALSDRFVQLGVDKPRVAFSEVLAFDLNGEAIHIVHQTPSYSNADALSHFHVANLLYFGEVFPGDGYPMIDFAQGGKLDGFVKTLGGWTDAKFHVVPARGEVTNGASLKAFCNMISTVRDRVQHMIEARRSEAEIIAEHPTAEFDDRWGHGRVPPDQFVRAVYRALTEQSSLGQSRSEKLQAQEIAVHFTAADHPVVIPLH